MDRSLAQDAVTGPAIGMIVVASLGIIAQLVGILTNLLQLGQGAMYAANDAGEAAIFSFLQGTGGIVMAVVCLISAGLIIYGSLKLQRLESTTWGWVAAILVMTPCLNPCCFLVGMPFGIWAIVAMQSPAVQDGFAMSEG